MSDKIPIVVRSEMMSRQFLFIINPFMIRMIINLPEVNLTSMFWRCPPTIICFVWPDGFMSFQEKLIIYSAATCPTFYTMPQKIQPIRMQESHFIFISIPPNLPIDQCNSTVSHPIFPSGYCIFCWRNCTK